MKVVDGVMRLDLHDADDLAALVRSGLVWKGGPVAHRLAVQYLREHRDEVNAHVPADVMSLLNIHEFRLG